MAAAIEVMRAGPEHLDDVMRILTEVNTWLIAKGITGQWPPVIPRDFIAGSLERDEVYLVRQGEAVLATCTLQWSDSGIWGDAAPDAVYVHRLAVSREHGGKGLGQLMLDWAATRARAEGKAFVRLDCWAENPYLVEYYPQMGFRQVGEVSVGAWRGCLFEKAV